MNYLEMAQQLAAAALEHGVVLTMTTEPALPLAMGNYTIKVEARPTRHAPVFCANCDSPLPSGCGGCFKDETQCALHVFDLGAMCANARQRVQDTINRAAESASLASLADHCRALDGVHRRHDFHTLRTSLWAPLKGAKR